MSKSTLINKDKNGFNLNFDVNIDLECALSEESVAIVIKEIRVLNEKLNRDSRVSSINWLKDLADIIENK